MLGNKMKKYNLKEIINGSNSLNGDQQPLITFPLFLPEVESSIRSTFNIWPVSSSKTQKESPILTLSLGQTPTQQ